jgi:hypothetical protein
VRGELEATLEPFRFELDYHFGYHPGDSATYLVRRLAQNQIASGALGDHVSHRAELGVVLLPNAVFAFEVSPSLRFDENPPLVQQGRELAFTRARGRYELGLELRLHAALGRGHRLELYYARPLLASYDEDPFFPIVMPEQGFGLAFRVSAP